MSAGKMASFRLTGARMTTIIRIKRGCHYITQDDLHFLDVEDLFAWFELEAGDGEFLRVDWKLLPRKRGVI